MNLVEWLRRKLDTSQPDLDLIEQLKLEVASLRDEGNRQRVRIIALIVERDCAVRELRTEQEAHCKTQSTMDRRLRDVTTHLLEPTQGDDCQKIRLRSRGEAEQFATRVERETGREPGSLKAYTCKVCPRQPVGIDRFWHVANTNPKHRTNRRSVARLEAQVKTVGRAKREGTLIEQRVSLESLEQLQRKLGS